MRLDHLLSKEKCFQERKHISVRQELSGIYCSILKVPIFIGILKKGIGKPESLTHGGVAQLGEHLLCKQGVRSSILLISTTAEARCKRQEARRVIAESVKHCKKRDKV